MATRAPFLKAKYSGYHHRHVPQEDTGLTHVGPDTPCGEYMRKRCDDDVLQFEARA